MATKTTPARPAPLRQKGALPAVDRNAASPWWAAAAVAAVIGMIASAIGLANVHAIYGQETASFVDQAIAQDLANLVVAGPATVLLAWLARRGSVRAHLLWTGVLTFTVYNYVIYTMSIHVGPLFLAWVAVLGLTFFSLVGGLRAVRPPAVAADLAGAPRRLVGWYLTVVGAVFTLLWLSDIVPAVLAGRLPKGAVDLALPSNPVHVLDLAVFLPAVIAIGRLVLLRRPVGLTLAPAATVFLVMTGLPILVTPLVAAARGEVPAWSVMGPVGVITAVGVAVLVVVLRPGPAAPEADGHRPSRSLPASRRPQTRP